MYYWTYEKLYFLSQSIIFLHFFKYFLLVLSLGGIPNTVFPWTGSFDEIQSKTNTTITTVGNNLKSLYWGTSTPQEFNSERMQKLKEREGITFKYNTYDHSMVYEEFDHEIRHKSAIETAFNSPIYSM